MEFAQIDAFWWLLAIPLFLGLGLHAERVRRRVAAAWGIGAPAAVDTAGTRRRLRQLAWSVALIGLSGAMAMPLGEATSRLLERRGTDVVIVLDLSNSMLARDVQPDRLRRARFEIDRLLDAMRGDRVGLVVFSGTSFMQTPLTTDYAILRNLLHEVEPQSMPYPGSNVASGIRKGLELVQHTPGGSRALVLLTDGEETVGDALRAAREAGDRQVPIFTIAIGTARGEPIPLQAPNGGEAILLGPDGKPVLSKLDEAGLQRIADLSGGRYFRIGPGGDAHAVAQVVQRLEKEMLEQRTVTERAALYPWWAVPALVFLLAGLWFREREYA